MKLASLSSFVGCIEKSQLKICSWINIKIGWFVFASTSSLMDYYKKSVVRTESFQSWKHSV